MDDDKKYFTWDIQKSGYDYTQYDEMGKTTFKDFSIEFEKFPWIEQAEIYEKIQKGCSATLSVTDHFSNKSFWVSIAKNGEEVIFLIGYVYDKNIKEFFGLGKTKIKKWVEIYVVQTKADILKFFEIFFNREFGVLESEIHKLDLFDEMEAHN